MREVTAILPRGQSLGFTLAGVTVREVINREEALRTLDEELDADHAGVILIDEDYLDDLPRRLRRRVDESTVPLVVGVPVISRWEYVSGQDDRFEKIVHRAIGYRIKL